jgi:hypothetical protein
MQRVLAPDPKDGYYHMPLMILRSAGRGRYGNQYSVTIRRDIDYEYEYGIKAYGFGLIENSAQTRARNYFVGSMVPSSRFSYSTLIDDLLDKYRPGEVPIHIKTFEETVDKMFELYMESVTDNETVIMGGSTPAPLEDQMLLRYAKRMSVDVFDPIFGLRVNTRNNEPIPYFQSYTARFNAAYEEPEEEVATDTDLKTTFSNLATWSTAFVGARVRVLADGDHDNIRRVYSVLAIDNGTGEIEYDDGVDELYDAKEFTGIDLSVDVGNFLYGGHDGEFEEIVVNGVARKPSPAEMKLLLSREYVRAFRGEKDKYILSPARIDLDFILDANYNLTITEEEGLHVDNTFMGIYGGASTLTAEDFRQLSMLSADSKVALPQDLNVKQAMYNLNQFRNRNGMTLMREEGAGCHLYLDTGLIGLKNIRINNELNTIINAMEQFDGRNTSIDFGFYEIIDPISLRKVPVTTMYFLAEAMVPHLVINGLNKPFVNKFAQIRNMVRNSFQPELDLIDWDVKERLYLMRINYYLTLEEGGVVQRAVQNTCQRDASALLEENNVRVLNVLKKALERNNRMYLYEWNDPVVRKGYLDRNLG